MIQHDEQHVNRIYMRKKKQPTIVSTYCLLYSVIKERNMYLWFYRDGGRNQIVRMEIAVIFKDTMISQF